MDDKEIVKIAIMLRSGRAILGLTQQELADKLGVQKSLLARVEKTDIEPKANILIDALSYFKDAGLSINLVDDEGGIGFRASAKAIGIASNGLADASKRRVDRKAGDSDSAGSDAKKTRSNKNLMAADLIKMGFITGTESEIR